MAQKFLCGIVGKEDPMRLWEFMDRAYNFVNVKDTLRALTDP